MGYVYTNSSYLVMYVKNSSLCILKIVLSLEVRHIR